MPRSRAIRANVKVINPAQSRASAASITGITYFQVLIFSSISAFKMPIRVTTNSFISSRVSASNVANDFSVCTVSPPDSQSNADQKSNQPRRQRDLHRIFADCLIGAQASPVIAEFRLTAKVHRLLADLAAKLSSLVACGMRHVLGIFHV